MQHRVCMSNHAGPFVSKGIVDPSVNIGQRTGTEWSHARAPQV